MIAPETFAPVAGKFGAHIAVMFFVVVPSMGHEDSDDTNDDLENKGNDDQYDDNRVVSGNNYHLNEKCT